MFLSPLFFTDFNWLSIYRCSVVEPLYNLTAWMGGFDGLQVFAIFGCLSRMYYG